jgi:hypothetical protein
MPEEQKKLSSFINNKNEINYEELSRTTDSIIKGTYSFDRLSLAEEQGHTKGGRENVEAFIILASDRRTNPSSYKGKPKEEIISRQEDLLRQYAKKERLLIYENIKQMKKRLTIGSLIFLKGKYAIPF